MIRVAVLGAGGWGTALAVLLGGKGYETRLWARRPEFAVELNRGRENRDYLPGVVLPDTVQVTSDMTWAVRGADLIVLCPPSHAMREIARQLSQVFPRGDPLVLSASKGLENQSLLRMSQVIAQELPRCVGEKLSVLSGPNFSAEVARGLPAATVIASRERRIAEQLQEWFMTPSFRVYTGSDVIGVEIGGALKNVIAIGVGIAEGLGIGYNARAALITRGLTEIARLGVALGAHPLTFSGLSGMGDLVLTCTGKYSRNRQAGVELGSGKSLEEIMRATHMVIEGIRTTAAAYELGKRHGVPMPITAEIYKVLFEGKKPRDSIPSLMMRDRTCELEEIGWDGACGS